MHLLLASLNARNFAQLTPGQPSLSYYSQKIS
jgi:hypothetical protein